MRAIPLAIGFLLLTSAAILAVPAASADECGGVVDHNCTNGADWCSDYVYVDFAIFQPRVCA